MIKGRLKAWNDEKGFGFIQSDTAGQDVFVHISALKNMSRKPVVGDIIYFVIERQNDGKMRAKNCEIEGVVAIKKTPPERSSRKASSSIVLKFAVVMVCCIGVFIYQQFTKPQNMPIPAQSADRLTPVTIEPSVNKFVCDGRQHCSQMTSRAEAEFFIANCPDTKMDGDKDGIPCENDSRF